LDLTVKFARYRPNLRIAAIYGSFPRERRLRRLVSADLALLVNGALFAA